MPCQCAMLAVSTSPVRRLGCLMSACGNVWQSNPLVFGECFPLLGDSLLCLTNPLLLTAVCFRLFDWVIGWCFSPTIIYDLSPNEHASKWFWSVVNKWRTVDNNNKCKYWDICVLSPPVTVLCSVLTALCLELWARFSLVTWWQRLALI